MPHPCGFFSEWVKNVCSQGLASISFPALMPNNSHIFLTGSDPLQLIEIILKPCGSSKAHADDSR
jgi:hypothetical protein